MKWNRRFCCALALCLVLSGGGMASASFFQAPVATIKEDNTSRPAFAFRGFDLNGVTLEEALAALQAENVAVTQETFANNETRLSFQTDFAGYTGATATLFFYNGTLFKGQYLYAFNYVSLEKIEADILGKLTKLYGERDFTRVQIDQDFQNARVFHWEAEANTCLDLMFPLSFSYDAQDPSKMAFKIEYYSLWPTLVQGPAGSLGDLPSSEDDLSGL